MESASLLPPPNAHVFAVRTWHRSHQAAKFSPAHVCVTSKHEVRWSLFFVARTRCSRTQALYPKVPPSRTFLHNVLRFDQPMDTSPTSHAIQQSHRNFNVAIKRSACSRGLAVGLANTPCCGVRGAQPQRKCGEVYGKPRGEEEGLF